MNDAKCDSRGRLWAGSTHMEFVPGAGADGTLYITSARNGLTAEELRIQPHAGSVFALATTTQGVAIHAFAA